MRDVKGPACQDECWSNFLEPRFSGFQLSNFTVLVQSPQSCLQPKQAAVFSWIHLWQWGTDIMLSQACVYVCVMKEVVSVNVLSLPLFPSVSHPHRCSAQISPSSLTASWTSCKPGCSQCDYFHRWSTGLWSCSSPNRQTTITWLLVQRLSWMERSNGLTECRDLVSQLTSGMPASDLVLSSRMLLLVPRFSKVESSSLDGLLTPSGLFLSSSTSFTAGEKISRV